MARRGDLFFNIYMIQANKIVKKLIIPQKQLEFNYNKGRYLTYKSDPLSGGTYSPSIELSGEKYLFYQHNNTNPLEFQNSKITPSHNNPEIFQTIIEDNSIRQALSGEIDISALKRFIFIAMIIVAAAIAGVMYFLTRMN